ncbi:esterase/lipase [Mycoplasmopsis bovigenitalium]|uniref:alpha/beta fold hydrolase n=1 Tax=Mycoplasmopsis bovigenitalium TaxID=2112 RepID=UPI00090B41D5|nr:alpha/beta hydrolase [Mycoplasmopsis bovigenitalium]BAW18220.1 esterase/lipase [Mycoplasmopsis bovigenitalium]
MKKIIYDYDFVFKDNNNENENIIFVHGFNSSAGRFKFFEQYWTKSNYYAIQFPGNNQVEPVNGHDVSVYQFAKLLVEFIEKNQLKNVTLIGHSMGGGTISLAYKMRPELFKKMVYVAPMNRSSLVTREVFYNTYFPKNFEEYLKFLEGLYYDISHFTNDEKWMRNTRELFDPKAFNYENTVKLGYSLPDPTLIDEIEKGLNLINVPTILILGEKDAVIDRENCIRYFNSQVKNIETHYIPKTGHMMFEENWQAFIDILEPFLDK